MRIAADVEIRKLAGVDAAAYQPVLLEALELHPAAFAAALDEELLEQGGGLTDALTDDDQIAGSDDSPRPVAAHSRAWHVDGLLIATRRHRV